MAGRFVVQQSERRFRRGYRRVNIKRELLAEGGQAKVYAVLIEGKKVEVEKRYLSTEDDKAKGERLAEKEFNRLGEINHPNIIRPLGLEKNVLLLPYYPRDLDQTDFEQWRVVNQLSVITASALMRFQLVSEVLSALCFLHQLKIVHKDLKPENILLTKKNKPVINDFGGADGKSGKVYSTIGIMPPEGLIDRRNTNCKWDVWSLGITVISMTLDPVDIGGGSFVHPFPIHEDTVDDQLRALREVVLGRTTLLFRQNGPVAKYLNVDESGKMNLRNTKNLRSTLEEVVEGMTEIETRDRFTAKKAKDLIDEALATCGRK